MPRSDRARVLAIGMDAAQGPLVRELVDRGELPGLAALLERGSWSRVAGPAFIGSGSVWPTFMSGNQPWEHGWYYEWEWRPDEMRIVRGAERRPVEPFWRELDHEGVSVGAVDVPFTRPVSLSHSFELAEWGSHERLLGHTASSPRELAAEVLRDPGPHPIGTEQPPDTDGPGAKRLAEIADSARRGIRMRGELGRRLLREREPDLLVLVFGEVHHTGHLLWHTVEPDHSLYAGKGLPRVRPPLVELYREVDRQVESLVTAAGDGARVVVFALHGMEPGGGLPGFVEPLLEERGFARRVDWRQGSLGQRARSAFGGLKRRAPGPTRRLYHRVAPLAVNRAIAGPTLVPPWDWRRTRAFSMATDQHGWLRVNLRGREREGIVPPSAYDETCRELEEAFGSLTDDAGRPLTRRVLRIDERTGGPPDSLPDVIVHWAEAALMDPVRLAGTSIEARPHARRLLGRHALEGFCISAGNGAVGDEIGATELHRLLRP
jgi:predicted AlkP superfamily phosphohydrolase/phosphomutase